MYHNNENPCLQCNGKVQDVVKYLVENGANLNAVDDQGHTPLQRAIQNSDLCAIKSLVEAGFKVNSVPFKFNDTVLNFTVSIGDLKTISFMLSLGCNIMQEDSYGRSAMHRAAMRGSIEIIELLHSKGVPLCLRDVRGITPLHLASWFGHEGAVAWFLDKGVSAEVKDKMGWTALHFAAEWNRIPVAEMLLKRSANVNPVDSQCHTPLYWSNYCGHNTMTELLYSWGGRENIFKNS